MSNALKRASVLLLFGVLASLAFAPYFTSGVSFYTYHALSGLMAIKHHISQSLFSGELPLWNPFMLCGAPFHSGIGVLDPLLIAHVLGDPVLSMMGSCYLALFISGLGMYLYLHKSWKLTIPASLLGGILYMFNPFFAATSHELPFMAPPVYLPFVFWFYEWGSREKNFALLSLSGVFLALSFFSGNLESYFFVILFFSVFQLTMSMLHASKIAVEKHTFIQLFHLIVAVGLSLLLIAIDLLPSLEMINYSGRSASGSIIHNTVHFGFIAALSLIALLSLKQIQKALGANSVWMNRLLAVGILLLFFVRWNRDVSAFLLGGNLFFPDVRQLMLGGVDSAQWLASQMGELMTGIEGLIPPRFVFYIQPPIYLFTLTTLIVFSALCAFSRSVKIRGWAIFGLLMIIFPYSNIPNLSHHLLGLDQIAFPRLMFGFFFILSAMIAYFFDYLERSASSDARAPLLKRAGLTLIMVGASGILLLLVVMIRKFNPEIIHTLNADMINIRSVIQRSLIYSRILDEVLVAYFDHYGQVIVLAGLKYISLISLGYALYRPQSVARYVLFLGLCLEVVMAWNLYTFQSQDIQTLSRSASYSELESMKENRGVGRVATISDPKRNLRNFYQNYSLPELSGNMPLFWNQRTIEGAALNLSPKIFSEFWNFEEANSYTPTVLREGTSKIYDLMGMTDLFSDFEITEEGYQDLGSGSRYRHYRNTRALPRFYFPKEVMFAKVDNFHSLVHNAAWKPAERAFVAQKPPDNFRTKVRADKSDSIKIVKEGYNYISLDVESIAAKFLATTEAFHPHWRVFIDGVEGEVIRTNFYFRGVYLKPGRHQVEFRYVSKAQQYGLWISLLTALGVILLFVVVRKRNGVR